MVSGSGATTAQRRRWGSRPNAAVSGQDRHTGNFTSTCDGPPIPGGGAVKATITRGTAEWRARLTATEPTTRCIACDELPTATSTVSPGWASWMPAAAAMSSSGMRPSRRTNPQRSSRSRNCSLAAPRSSRSTSSKVASISATAPGDSESMLDRWATYTTSMVPGRPCSSLTAASSARAAGGEPSYPTTMCRFGTMAFITTKAIRSSVRPGIRHGHAGARQPGRGQALRGDWRH